MKTLPSLVIAVAVSVLVWGLAQSQLPKNSAAETAIVSIRLAEKQPPPPPKPVKPPSGGLHVTQHIQGPHTPGELEAAIAAAEREGHDYATGNRAP
jgi:hypothetical protein